MNRTILILFQKRRERRRDFAFPATRPACLLQHERRGGVNCVRSPWWASALA